MAKQSIVTPVDQYRQNIWDSFPQLKAPKARARYILRDGAEVTREQIETAFARGDAVLIYGRGENHTTSSLMLDGKQWDTRGQCFSMREESWARRPLTLAEALGAARA